ncbi:MAG TPA: hypothetical protein PKH94_04525 [Bacteroidales bacterium]|nr:hypothetical protein [Bacteroidales bacterium]
MNYLNVNEVAFPEDIEYRIIDGLMDETHMFAEFNEYHGITAVSADLFFGIASQGMTDGAGE